LSAAELEQRATLLQIHRGLLRMCAARGDLLAVLALPDHYREDDAIDYVASLAPSARPDFDAGAPLLDLPLGFGEMQALTYAAVYHPWLIEQDARPGAAGTNGLRRIPPDGAMCGLLAARALARGAWVAPANQTLAGVVALTPPLARARWLDLQDAQINVIRQEPGGFLTFSADTLARDPDLLQINVRRLMQLLRRMAEQMGPGLVFEPMGDAFQRLVRREVEAMLRVLFDRGAFSGATAETSYQVNVRATPQDLDEGRFIVEIRVAPSRPMQFLTVRLVQTGDRAVVTEER
jgi:phage tail sheath protein FI